MLGGEWPPRRNSGADCTQRIRVGPNCDRIPRTDEPGGQESAPTSEDGRVLGDGVHQPVRTS